ncbi:MAG: cyanophycinase [Gemmatimonadaceae bacterium]
MKTLISRHIAVAVLSVSPLAACATSGAGTASSTDAKVGPPRGAAMVVGGGAVGSEILQRFIELAGGPDALIIDIPTSGGAASYDQNAGASRAFRAAGAKNVLVLHTSDRRIADSDSFVAPIKRAGGVWFDGGRHYRLVDSYGGTRTEAAFHEVLARGGVVGGSSAGASIQGSFLVRGAPSNNNGIMAYPGYEKGFGFLRGVGIDQHVVARERLPDLADSIMPKHPELLLISEDEGTAWVVQGDIGEIIGRSKAFVYNGRDKTDEGKPFLTLWPGDKYNLATRRVIHRAISETRLTHAFVDSVFHASVGAAPATVLIAQNGKVLVNKSYNVPAQRRFMPTTTSPNFELRGISDALNAVVAAELSNGSGTTYAQAVSRRITGPAGMPRTRADSVTRMFSSNVDELYRWDRVLSAAAPSAGREARAESYGTPDRKRNAFVRFPARNAVIIILTDSDSVKAGAMADQIAVRLLGQVLQ